MERIVPDKNAGDIVEEATFSSLSEGICSVCYNMDSGIEFPRHTSLRDCFQENFHIFYPIRLPLVY